MNSDPPPSGLVLIRKQSTDMQDNGKSGQNMTNSTGGMQGCREQCVDLSIPFLELILTHIATGQLNIF